MGVRRVTGSCPTGVRVNRYSIVLAEMRLNRLQDFRLWLILGGGRKWYLRERGEVIAGGEKGRGGKPSQNLLRVQRLLLTSCA